MRHGRRTSSPFFKIRLSADLFLPAKRSHKALKNGRPKAPMYCSTIFYLDENLWLMPTEKTLISLPVTALEGP